MLFVTVSLRRAAASERARRRASKVSTLDGRGRSAAGYALKTLARWSLGVLGIPRLELNVEPWNEASIRTAERAGFQQEGLLRNWQDVGGKRKDMLMYSLLPTDLPGHHT